MQTLDRLAEQLDIPPLQDELGGSPMQFLQRFALVAIASRRCRSSRLRRRYPAKPIRMIVPLAAASAVDNGARIVAAEDVAPTWARRS